LDSGAIAAWVEPSDVPAFKACWQVYTEHYDEIAWAVAPHAQRIMPRALGGWGEDSERLRDDGRSTIQLVWSALETDNWREVEARFEARGELFATYGVNIDTWVELVLLGQEAATPLLVASSAHDPERLSRMLCVLQGFWRRAVSTARRRYVERAAELAEEQRRALRRSEARYRALAESGIVGTLIADTTGRILEANDAFLRMLDFTREDVAAGRLRWDDLTPPEWLHVSEQALRELAQSGWARPREKRYRRRDGSLVPVLVGVAALEPPQTITFVLDLSERQRLEEQLRQSQKLEAIGSLAGGVAHDFNNLLSVILSNCDLLLEDLADESPLRQEVEEVRRAGERASALTAQLLAFSRKQVLRPRVIELGDVVRGMEPLVRRLVGSPIQLTILPPTASARVFADPHQIEQVLMNLVVNARDAMPEGGRLTVEVTERELDGEAAEFLGLAAETYVALSVSDTGAGMDTETRARIFEPFFSTKGDRGTGLGLSTVFGIVRQHEGAIGVDSEIGVGTTFSVLLPRTGRAAESERPPERKVDLSGHETILLVEDEEDVRRIMVEVLGRQGYRVLDARHGKQALEVSAAHAGTIDLLVTDLVMPHWNGREVAERIRQARPTTRVLYISGYAADTHFNHGPLAVDAGFLAKPITPQNLLESVRRTLDARRPAPPLPSGSGAG